MVRRNKDVAQPSMAHRALDTEGNLMPDLLKGISSFRGGVFPHHASLYARLAREGQRFENGHASAAVCTPTTGTPCARAAVGCSPQAVMRSPSTVRDNSHHEKITSSGARKTVGVVSESRSAVQASDDPRAPSAVGIVGLLDADP